jgi:hypothetical protein
MAARKKSVDATDPAEFDFDAWIAGVKPARFTAPLYRRGDLISQIDDLRSKIDQSGRTEFSLAEGDPVAEMVVEHNALVDQFEASREDFVFRPAESGDQKAVLAELEADGLSVEDESASAYMMARTCVSHPMSGAQMQRLRATVGEPAFNLLATAWSKAWTVGGERSAPFSPLPLPTPETTES